MKKFVIYFLATAVLISLGWLANSFYQNYAPDPVVINPVIPRPLEKYTIENLAISKPEEGNIQIEEVISEENDFTSYLFSLEFKPSLQDREIKKMTGQLNIPTGKGKYPVIVMFRGYVDQEIYETGIGTRKSAEVYAQNGFITIAPDFLGYAGSDLQAENIFEARFQTYTAALSVLNSLDSISSWDGTNIFLWGHSNGGQVALTILEITGDDYPTVLWAPVTKPFPYSILYYTDEAEDRGKYIRRELAKFENLYNVEQYSISNYLERIDAPIQFHQGTADDSVPLEWTNEFVNVLDELEKEVTYYMYSGADHNMTPAWNTVVERNLVFFNKYLK
ncbi:prolyl oligopeptidase family serine peptidase [Patescibacteria group bacterium]|nr:prolyl oligopeptidase family serine peptidase [Patescibacteria group bacterium]MBU0777066.1 prolyl oligopeptidase family serine peptidase [Patescibacteria group bacterium]MBU0845760.1 prolyl oligopeptidase family serine peptidase [Patescibacteria group bacterium]MBU0923190.1 prolyl oligopeptidase family serine peptidase [Patescibacteria group bacterium]MBU1066480.1 prolyl oligopeptidase family serine peptidase [Patescibacteria group bacterium]